MTARYIITGISPLQGVGSLGDSRLTARIRPTSVAMNGQLPAARVAADVARPNLFIVGAARAGTTSLYFYLSQHPEIFMSPMKEPHFFSRIRPDPRFNLFYPYIDDDATYLELFAGAAGAKVRGEASPSYLWVPDAAKRIKAASPEARIIIILRDPVGRAYSHYLVDVVEGLDDRPFATAIREDMARDAPRWGQSPMYVHAGLYADGVERYLRLFRNRVKVLIFEEFIGDLRASLEDIFRFLEVDADYAEQIDTEPRNVFHLPRNRLAQRILGSLRLREHVRALLPAAVHPAIRRMLVRPGNKPAMDPAARALLTEYYRRDVARLTELLGRPLPW